MHDPSLFDRLEQLSADTQKPLAVVLTGAGMSAESGVPTFRDANGLWEGHDVMKVATPEGFQADPELVLRFYNERRRAVQQVEPNKGHRAVAQLEDHYNVAVITQNVDDLHERAGSNVVVHLHGELNKARSSTNPELVYDLTPGQDIQPGDTCEEGSQLRPAVVWFGEAVPMIVVAEHLVSQADVALVVGTSMQVYPAAGLTEHLQEAAPIHVVNPDMPAIAQRPNLHLHEEPATTGVPKVVEHLIQERKQRSA